MELRPDRYRSAAARDRDQDSAALPLAWRAFIEYCRQLGHGQIERLVIQDGVPVMAEVTRQKVKFTK